MKIILKNIAILFILVLGIFYLIGCTEGYSPISVKSIEYVDDNGEGYVYKIEFYDNSSYEFTIPYGPAGEAGSTPYVGENNNWWIGNEDTGISVIGPVGPVGSDGSTPYIGENGNWWIDGEDTGVIAEGQTGEAGTDGSTPYIGENGNWWIGGQDTGVTADYSLIVDTYFTITFMNENENEVGTQQVLEGAGINVPSIKKEGYTLDGWYTSLNEGTTFAEKWSFIKDKVYSDLTLYAKWIVNQYTISFESNGGSKVIGITQDYNSTVNEPYEPKKEGFIFNGWYSDKEFTSLYDFTTMPAENVTLYAKWAYEQYAVSYYTYTENYDQTLSIPLQYNETIVDVFLGEYHSAAITSEGRIFTWGYNHFGQLGDGTITNSTTPIDITTQFKLNKGESIIQVSLGFDDSIALTSEGRVFTWGYNAYGQLGDGTTTKRTSPVNITTQFDLSVGEEIIKVSLGHYHSSALTSKGRIFTWGHNFYGVLGDGTNTNQSTPLDITSNFKLTAGETINKISLGSDHSSALTSKGRIFTWGDNNYGQLGDGTMTTRTSPVEITTQFDLILGETIKGISLASRHSSAITSEGRIFTWGYNDYGQLGDGTTSTRTSPVEITTKFDLNEGEVIVQISLGYSHSIALTSEGRVFTWGSNFYGALGDGTTTTRTSPVDITTQFELSVGEEATKVSLGYYHSSVLTSEGMIFTWGYNNYGQLANGEYTNEDIPFKVNIGILAVDNVEIYDFEDEIIEYIPVLEGYTFNGWYIDTSLEKEYSFSTMPAENINLYASWKKEYSITYYVYADNYDPMTNIPLNYNETIIQTTLGYNHSLALTSEGRVFTWGYNAYGQLGDGTMTTRTSPVEITTQFDLMADETIIQLSSGVSHSSALTSEGRVFTWGYNAYGQLGDNTTSTKTSPTEITTQFNLAIDEKIVEVILGRYYSSALTSEGRLFMWGYNNYGQLGDGTTTTRTSPVDITTNFNLNIEEKITEVSLGNYHSSAITSEGRVFTWGYNAYGHLGNGSISNSPSPVDITTQFNLAVGEEITHVSLGRDHSSAITSEGRMYVWGYNDFGQLGDGTTSNRTTPVDITTQFNLAIGEKITKIFLGSNYSSAITSEGRIFTWGDNAYGQLGDGSNNIRTTPVDITSQFNLAIGEEITEVFLSNSHSSVITTEGRIFSWGDNTYGQLGDGTTTSKNSPIESLFRFPITIYVDKYNYGEIVDVYEPLIEGDKLNSWYLDNNMSESYILTIMPKEDLILFGYWSTIE